MSNGKAAFATILGCLGVACISASPMVSIEGVSPSVSALRFDIGVLAALPVGQSLVSVSGRKVVIHNPGLSGSVPLVMAIHGWYGWAEDTGSFCHTGNIESNSATFGFIGVCPDGYRERGVGSWNAAGCCGAAVLDQSDDVQFLRDVVAYVKERASISKVYSMGLSNGAMMSFRLACEANDVFDGGIAPFAGGWYGEPAFDVIGSHPVPNNWTVETFDCSNGSNPECSSCYDSASYPSDTECWRPATHSCTLPAANFRVLYTHGETDTEEPYVLVVDNFKHYAQDVLGCEGFGTSPAYEEGQATCFEYASCPEGRRVAFCTVAAMGHKLPRPDAAESFDGVRAAWSWIHEGQWPAVVTTTAPDSGVGPSASVLLVVPLLAMTFGLI